MLVNRQLRVAPFSRPLRDRWDERLSPLDVSLNVGCQWVPTQNGVQTVRIQVTLADPKNRTEFFQGCDLMSFEARGLQPTLQCIARQVDCPLAVQPSSL